MTTVVPQAKPASSDLVTPSASGRLVSLDALRGFDMLWIIGLTEVVRGVVSASGSPSLAWIPSQLQHVEWEGFHFYDLIFPLFLFLIGMSIPFALGKRLLRGESRASIYRHIVLRAAILIVLGMMVNGGLLTYDPAKFALSYSVLQMLALGYLVASILLLNLRLRGQVLATIAMLLGYWALLAFVPGPGHEVGKFRENCNLGDWVTEFLFGKWRMGGREVQVGWVLGILGHASTAMLGVFAGELLRSSQSGFRKLCWLVLMGLACLAAGVFWCGWVAEAWPQLSLFGANWTEWPVWFPIIKNRWTSSFVLYAGGWSFLLVALFYLVIDVWGLRRWAFPLVVVGSNSIFAYMAWQLGSGVFRQAAAIFLGGLKQYVSPPWYEPLSWAGALVTLWLLLWFLHCNKTFLRV